jgi:hypothetical protein
VLGFEETRSGTETGLNYKLLDAADLSVEIPSQLPGKDLSGSPTALFSKPPSD